MARQVTRHAVVFTYRFRHVAPLGAPSQRHYGAGPRFLRSVSPCPRLSGAAPFGQPHLQASGKPHGPPSASSWQGIVVSPGGAPAPPGSLGGAFIPRPRAPHPIPLS